MGRSYSTSGGSRGSHARRRGGKNHRTVIAPSRNAYRNKPFPRKVKDSVARGYQPWEPHPNPGAAERSLPGVRKGARRARFAASTKHQAQAPRSVPPSSGEVRWKGVRRESGIERDARATRRGKKWSRRR